MQLTFEDLRGLIHYAATDVYQQFWLPLSEFEHPNVAAQAWNWIGDFLNIAATHEPAGTAELLLK